MMVIKISHTEDEEAEYEQLMDHLAQFSLFDKLIIDPIITIAPDGMIVKNPMPVCKKCGNDLTGKMMIEFCADRVRYGCDVCNEWTDRVEFRKASEVTISGTNNVSS